MLASVGALQHGARRWAWDARQWPGLCLWRLGWRLAAPGPPGGADARSVVARSAHRGGAGPSGGGRAAPVAAGGASSGGGGLDLFRFYERSSGRA